MKLWRSYGASNAAAISMSPKGSLPSNGLLQGRVGISVPTKHGGHDFKRSNVTGQLVFVEDPCEHHGASVVGSISITQYRMHYMGHNGISMIEGFDETHNAMQMYEAVLDDERDRDDYNCEVMQGDVQVVQRIEVVLPTVGTGSGSS
jgi:hypothetical protein